LSGGYRLDTRGKLHNWPAGKRPVAGKRHACARLIPARIALVVIDMVPFFVAEDGYARGIVPVISRLAGALREAGGTVAWALRGLGARQLAPS
jgi:hypothetical protein